MPKGIYLRTEIHAEQLAYARSNIKNRYAWNKGLTKKEYPSLSGGREKGYKHSEKSKQKMRKSRIFIKNMFTQGTKGKTFPLDKYPNYGMRNKKQSKDAREKVRIANIGKKLSENTRDKIKAKRLHQVFPLKDTSIELLLQNALKKEGILFTTHIPIFGQPDIFIQPNICVFCDGDYWHNRDDYKKRDKVVNKTLIKSGYIVLRFWEHEIKNNTEDCIEIIKCVSPLENEPLHNSQELMQVCSMN